MNRKDLSLDARVRQEMALKQLSSPTNNLPIIGTGPNDQEMEVEIGLAIIM